MTTSQRINQIVNTAPKGKIRDSLFTLIKNGYVRTGQSGYSKGWKSYSVWTTKLVIAAEANGIIVERGNDAPRNGANGEFVKLVSDLRKNKLVQKYQAILARHNQILKSKAQRKAKERADYVVNLHNELTPRIIEVMPRIKSIITSEMFEDWTANNEKLNQAVGIVGYHFAKNLGWKTVVKAIRINF